MISIGALKAQESLVEKYITDNDVLVYSKVYYQSFVYSFLDDIENGEIGAYTDSLFTNAIKPKEFLSLILDDTTSYYVGKESVSNYIRKKTHLELYMTDRYANYVNTKKAYCYIKIKDFEERMNNLYFIQLFFKSSNNLDWVNFNYFTKSILDSVKFKISMYCQTVKQFDSAFYPYYTKPEAYYFEYTKSMQKNYSIKLRKFSLYGDNNIRFFIIRKFTLKDLKKILKPDEVKFLKFVFFQSL